MKDPATTLSEARRLSRASFTLIMSLITFCGFAGPIWAAMATTHEEKQETLIFDSHNFGSDTIDLRFNPTETLIDGNLLDIDSGGDFNHLASNIVRLFFVDTVTSCGGSGSFAGCAEIGGNDVVLNSAYAAHASWGHVLSAHEIGHNLELEHNNTLGNVMRDIVGDPANVNFSLDQIATIRVSSLIQYGGPLQTGQRFINITPILVSTASVPLPGAVVLFLRALMPFAVFGKKCRRDLGPA